MSSLALCADGGIDEDAIRSAKEAICARLLFWAANRAFDRELRLARCRSKRRGDASHAVEDANEAVSNRSAFGHNF